MIEKNKKPFSASRSKGDIKVVPFKHDAGQNACRRPLAIVAHDVWVYAVCQCLTRARMFYEHDLDGKRSI